MTPAELAETVTSADPIRRRTDIDLEAAIGLLERGCPPETAMRILL